MVVAIPLVMGGEPKVGEDGTPEVKMCMQACAWSVLVQTIMVVAIPLVMGGEPKVGEDGTPEVKNDGSTLATALTALRYVCMLGMYGGVAGRGVHHEPLLPVLRHLPGHRRAPDVPHVQP